MNEAALDHIRVLAARFYQDREVQGIAPYTIVKDRTGVGKFLEFLKNRDEDSLTRITAETLHQFQMHLYGLSSERGAPFKLNTQGGFLSHVKAFFLWLTRRGHILADPSAGLKLPKIVRSLPRGVMTRREVEKIIAQPNVDKPGGLRDRAVLEVLYSTGIRAGEIRRLKLYDVDTAKEELRIQHGKGGKDRVVPLGSVAAKYVELYLQEARAKILKDQPDDGALFIGRFGRPMDDTLLNRTIIRKYAERAGLKRGVTAHCFRHTCATHLLQGHADLRHIQTLLGHANLEATQIYTHVEIGDLKRVHRRCHPRERPA